MIQEDRELLFKDLCTRLPYDVKVKIGNNLYIVVGIDIGLNDEGEWVPRVCTRGMTPVEIEYCKPYLFPMSSMTEEQKKEYRKACELDTEILSKHPMDETPFPALYNSQDWLDAHHFDYRGLIPMGLANDATGLNIY